MVVQGACAAPGAGNELCLDDRKVDSAGLRIAIDRRPYHHDSCSLNFLFLAPVTESTGEPDAAALRRLVRLLYASFEISDVLLQFFIHLIDRIGVISFHYFETRRHTFYDAVYF